MTTSTLTIGNGEWGYLYMNWCEDTADSDDTVSCWNMTSCGLHIYKNTSITGKWTGTIGKYNSLYTNANGYHWESYMVKGGTFLTNATRSGGTSGKNYPFGESFYNIEFERKTTTYTAGIYFDLTRTKGDTSYFYEKNFIVFTIPALSWNYTLTFNRSKGRLSSASNYTVNSSYAATNTTTSYLYPSSTSSTITFPSAPTKSSTNTIDYSFTAWGMETYPYYTFSANQSVNWSNYKIDATFYPIWSTSTRTYYAGVSYDKNGGTGSMSSSSGAVTYNGTTSFSVKSCSFTAPTGYHFSEWNTAKDGSGTSYDPYNTIYVESGTTTLYAIWEKDSITYTLTYNANGGSGVPSSQSYTTTASSYTFTISSIKPTRSGYQFLGWSKSPSATSSTYDPEDPYTTTSASNVLYAVWKQLTTFTINFDANGGSGAPSSISQQLENSESNFGDISSIIPTRTNYKFIGWNQSGQSSSQRIASESISGTTVTTTNNNWTFYQYCINTGGYTSGQTTLNLKAVWQLNPRYDIYAYFTPAAGGSISQTSGSTPYSHVSDTSYEQYQFFAGDSCTLIATSTSDTANDNTYRFLGWSTSSNTSDIINTTTTYTFSDINTTPLSIYAIFEKYSTITFDANGGSLGDIPSTNFIYKNSAYYLPNSIPTIVGDYIFKGWATSSSATTAQWSAGALYKSAGTTTSNQTLYAIWEEISDSDIIYDVNNGTRKRVPEKETMSYSQSYSITTYQPTRQGFNFLGWSTNKNTNTAEYASGDLFKEANVIPVGAQLYAIWQLKDVPMIYIYDSNYQPKAYLPYVYYKGNWVLAKGYVYTGNGWKQSAETN